MTGDPEDTQNYGRRQVSIGAINGDAGGHLHCTNDLDLIMLYNCDARRVAQLSLADLCLMRGLGPSRSRPRERSDDMLGCLSELQLLSSPKLMTPRLLARWVDSDTILDTGGSAKYGAS